MPVQAVLASLLISGMGAAFVALMLIGWMPALVIAGMTLAAQIVVLIATAFLTPVVEEVE